MHPDLGLVKASGNGTILDVHPQSFEILLYGIEIFFLPFFLMSSLCWKGLAVRGNDGAGAASEAVPMLVPGYVLAAALFSHAQSRIFQLLAGGTDTQLSTLLLLHRNDITAF